MAEDNLALQSARLGAAAAAVRTAAAGIAALARRDGLARAGALPGSATCAVTGPADIARRVAVLAADLANWADGVSGGGQRLTEADDAARRRIAGS